MTSSSVTGADLTVGRAGAHTASFRAAHRDVGNDTPVTTSVVLTVPMSHEDIEAVFWRMLRDEGVTFAELEDDATACWYLFDALIGNGVSEIEPYRLGIAQLTPTDPHHEPVTRLRRRVEQLFGPRRRCGSICRASAARRRGVDRPPLNPSQ